MSVTPRVLFVTVNFNGADHTERLLASLKTLHNRDLMTIAVVDNASTDDSEERLRVAAASDKSIFFFRTEKWRGYFGVAQWALDKWVDEGRELPDWIILSNNDVLIADPNFLQTLLRVADPAVGVTAPVTRSLRTGLDQNPFMQNRPSGLQVLLFQLWLLNYPVALMRDWLSRNLVRPARHLYRKVKHRWRVPVRGGRAQRAIYAAHATFLIFSRRFFAEGGVLDGSCGLCGEEIIIAETCRRLSLQIVYEPSLEILHNEHSTVGRSLSRHMYQFHRRAWRYLASTYLADVQVVPVHMGVHASGRQVENRKGLL
jgi:GT2 family glycosyltransferase